MLDLSLKKALGGFSIDVELSLGPELLVLFGPSGAGKSLLLKLLAGIIRPDEGRVTIDARVIFDGRMGVDAPMRTRRIGFVFQDYSLFPHKTVRENIAYGMDGLPPDETRERAAGLINVMRLGGLDARYPGELSGGQKQRVALARTLGASPRILLLDEPFSALDYQVREKLRADLLTIHRLYPITTILVTHDLEEAFMLGERIAVINNGRIEQVGTREEVFYRPATRNVARFMGARNIFSGRVEAVDAETVVIHNPDIGRISAFQPPGAAVAPGREVTFCIRPEEVIIIKPDKAVGGKDNENVVEGEITSVMAKGATHVLFLRAGERGAALKVELPNFVVRKLGLATGAVIKVLLKKESVWVIP
ncbi:MAG: ABC transporter ATP-binding protein [Deltaproteobacteria bacterium]|nr:ABC transporter ATP-binding protein [Deltaproteobacteria bacterium]